LRAIEIAPCPTITSPKSSPKNTLIASPPGSSVSPKPTSEELLMQVAQEVGKIESTTQRQEVSSYVQLMAGLRFDKTLIKKLFQEDIMKESVIYQEIFETGEQQGLQREKAYIIRQIVKKVGEMPQELRSTVELLSIDQLEVLGEALLDFTNLQDLQNWLRPNSSLKNIPETSPLG
jgi:predicted transposase YdaD